MKIFWHYHNFGNPQYVKVRKDTWSSNDYEKISKHDFEVFQKIAERLEIEFEQEDDY